MTASRIHRLTLTHFRNYRAASLETQVDMVVLAGPNGNGGSFSIGEGSTQQLTVSSAQLDSSGNVVQIQQVAGGPSVVVPLSVPTGSFPPVPDEPRMARPRKSGSAKVVVPLPP